MAIAAITVTKLKPGTEAAMPTATAIASLASTDKGYVTTTHTLGAKIPVEGKGIRILMIFQNVDTTDAAAIRVLAGDNPVVGGHDLSLSVAASSTEILCVESGKYLQMNGQFKDHIVITGAEANLKVSAIQLPN